MKIGELARRSGFKASAIRFYESRGLIGAAARQSNGYRDYPEDAVLALGIINGLQQAGFTLDELRAFVPADLANWPHDELLERLNRKVEKMRAAEKRLRHGRKQLQAVLRIIYAHERVIGVDITGECSASLDYLSELKSAAVDNRANEELMRMICQHDCG